MNRETWPRSVFITLLALVVVACTYNKPAPEKPVIEGDVKFFDDETRNAFDNYRQEIIKPRTPTVLQQQGTNYRITTCSQFLELLERGLSLENVRVDHAFSEYQPCLALSILRYGQAPRVSYFNHEALGEQILKHLNLATLRSSLYARAESPKQGFTFSDFKFPSVKTAPHSVSLEDDGWYYGVTMLAASDFDGDGIEDVVATFYDDAKAGTYFSVTTLLLTQTVSGGWIMAEDASKFVRGSGDY